MSDVWIYAKGPLSCSVCAPAEMGREEVEDAVNSQHPCGPVGSTLRWRVADDEFFKDGTTPNGGIVDCDKGHTRHWFLDC